MARASERAATRWRYFGMLGQLRMALSILDSIAHSPLVSPLVQNLAFEAWASVNSVLRQMQRDYQAKPKEER